MGICRDYIGVITGVWGFRVREGSKHFNPGLQVFLAWILEFLCFMLLDSQGSILIEKAQCSLKSSSFGLGLGLVRAYVWGFSSQALGLSVVGFRAWGQGLAIACKGLGHGELIVI